jgi:NADPH2:quinone reductase
LAAGKTVLIAGGAGAVAHYAIQLAKRHGAEVITTVSSAEKAEIARSAGADHCINYRRENIGERVRSIAGSGVDAVIEVDLSANASLLPAVLRPRGIVVVYGTGPEARLPASFCLVNSISVRFFLVYELTLDERQRAIAEITRLLENGGLTHNVAKTFVLDDIVAAHEAVEQARFAGNVVVRVANA